MALENETQASSADKAGYDMDESDLDEQVPDWCSTTGETPSRPCSVASMISYRSVDSMMSRHAEASVKMADVERELFPANERSQADGMGYDKQMEEMDQTAASSGNVKASSEPKLKQNSNKSTADSWGNAEAPWEDDESIPSLCTGSDTDSSGDW
mmetsp:Transcript_7144/g.11363  ORF Transcript_7144/g.11363 Transcript_7144/m.11363 type:complete len:155 (+) Transcript_7144:257-721(+)